MDPNDLLEIQEVTRAKSKDSGRNSRKSKSKPLDILQNEEISESIKKVDKIDEVNNHDLYDLMGNLDVDPFSGSNNQHYSNMLAMIKGDVEEQKQSKQILANRNNVFENGLRASGVKASNSEGSSAKTNININENSLNLSIGSSVLTDKQNSQSGEFFIEYKDYESELQMQDIMRLIQAELSEPYSIYTYRYFIYNWPKLCFLAAHNNEYVGAIVCKLDMHLNVIKRGYIAMLAVKKEYRKMKIGTNLVQRAIEAMLADDADEVVLETEMKNLPALRLYENLGFVRDKRLFRYYLNGVDALRLKLWFR